MPFISLLENKVGQRRLAELVRTGGALNKGSYSIWRHKEFSEFQFQMTHRWNLFDFKPLENPRKGVCSCIRGPFDPHGLAEGKRKCQFPGKMATLPGWGQGDSIPKCFLGERAIVRGFWMFKTARDHLLEPSHPLEGTCEVPRGGTCSGHTGSNTGA